MKEGDKVKFTLCDKEFTGSILKIHRKESWKGYVNVMLEDKAKIEIPATYLEVISESR